MNMVQVDPRKARVNARSARPAVPGLRDGLRRCRASPEVLTRNHASFQPLYLRYSAALRDFYCKETKRRPVGFAQGSDRGRRPALRP